MSLANKLTISRIVLAFIILILLVFPFEDLHLSFPSFLVMGRVVVDVKYLIAGFLFAMASLTDYLDGAIARKENSVSDFGAAMDAIADKVLVNGVLIILAYQGFLNVIVPVIIITRDICMDALRLLSAKNGVIIAASKWGKAKTICMLVGITLLLFYNLPFEIWNIYLAEILIYIATILSIVSFAFYFTEWKKKYHFKN